MEDAVRSLELSVQRITDAAKSRAAPSEDEVERMLDAAGALASALRLLGDGCTPLSPPQSPATRAPVVLTKFIAEMCGSNPTHPAHAQVYRVQILSAVSVASGSMHMNVSDGAHCIEMQCPCASGQASRSAADSVMVADITIENSRVVDPPRTPLLISWFNDVSETMLNPYVQVGSPTSMVLVAASADGSAHGSAMSTRPDRGGGGVIAGVGGGGGGSGGNGDSDDDGSTATSDASDGALDVDNFDDEQCTGQCRYVQPMVNSLHSASLSFFYRFFSARQVCLVGRGVL